MKDEFANNKIKNLGMMQPRVDEEGEVVVKPSALQLQTDTILEHYTIIRFRNRPMYMVPEPFEHYIPLTRERFENIAYNLIQPIPTRSRVGDCFDAIKNRAMDMTHNQHLILFGQRSDTISEDYRATVWDCDTLSATGYEPERCVWRSPYPQLKSSKATKPVEFIMQLAGGDQGLYDDIMQSMAPMIMTRKPDGVVWWIGDGANGKSTLMDALYRIFPGQLASLTVRSLADGRDAPALNGQLANIVKESSEGRIDDTESYKAIGTHEDFSVHTFNKQDPTTILGNMHHIFSGNSIPIFNDKGFSARRRTFIIPFGQQFESDPTFEERTFTPEFFSHLITEMCNYAKRIREQGYRYKWSVRTLAAKADYDTSANTAENYVKELVETDGVIGFDNFGSVRIDYENWCREEGQVPLGAQNMRRAIMAAGFERISVRSGEVTTKGYRLPNIKEADTQQLGLGRPGLYTVPGFQAPKPVEVPNFEGPEPASSIIGNKW